MIVASRIPQSTEQVRQATLRAQEAAGRTQRTTVPEQPIIEYLERLGYRVLAPAAASERIAA